MTGFSCSPQTPTRTLPTPCARDGKGPGHQHGLPRLVETGQPTDPTRTRQGRTDAQALLPTPTATSYGSNRSPSPGAATRPSLNTLATSSTYATTAADPPAAGAYLPTPRATDGTKGSPAQRGSRGDLTLPSAAVRVPTPPTTIAGVPVGLGQPDHTRWGSYTPAVAGWEQLLGRAAPEPTQTGRHGKPVLAPAFVEWLQGLPEQWVTGLDLPRTVALRLLGNGVVPQQATAALRALLLIHAHHPAGTT